MPRGVLAPMSAMPECLHTQEPNPPHNKVRHPGGYRDDFFKRGKKTFLIQTFLPPQGVKADLWMGGQRSNRGH
jgi:hypothetical protein